MKKLFFLILALTALCGSASAQFSFKGQWNLSASGGWIPEKGFNATVGGEKALGSRYSGLHVKFNFMQNQAQVDHQALDHFNYQTYQLFVNYSYSFAKFLPHPLYIQYTVGMNGGYENISKSPISTLVIENSNRYVYGVNTSLQIEISAARNFAIYLEPRFIYNFNSDIRKGFFIAGFGFKYYL